MTSSFASRGWIGLALGGALFGVAAQPASALDFSRHPKDNADTNAILAKGRISDGDASDLNRHFTKLPKKPNTVIYLESPGGNVQESMLLGKFFYQNRIVTRVDAKKVCASACAIAFLGGRGADGKPQRIKSSTGKLGLHSFSREFPDDRRYNSDDMKQLLQNAQTQVGVLTEYVRSVEADQDVMRIMLTATHSQMNFIENDDAIGLGFQVFDEKTQAFVDPAPVRERIAKKRAEDRIKAATAPVTKPDDEERPFRPRRQRTTTVTPDDEPTTQPSRRRTTTTTTRTPGAGGSDSPGIGPSGPAVVRRDTPRDTPRVMPRSNTGRHNGIAESGTR